MISNDDLQALLDARHPDPFAVLGMHATPDGALWVRALLPGATAVTLRDTATGRRVVALAQRDPAGFWEVLVPRRRKLFDYRLEVQWADGSTTRLADPYRYGPLLGDWDLHFLGEGSHLRPFEALGAHPVTLGEGVYEVSGVRFAVWAPNASRVSVVGNFNAWDGRRHPMRHRGASGVWELFIPHVVPGDLYKFELRSREGVVLPLKCDPYARASQRRPENASQVAEPLPPRRPLTAKRAAANHRQAPMSIYEVHLGSWRRHPDGSFHSWDDLAAALPAYAADLGFTHIELLPITEHPFDGSWGYQTLGQYAPSARFGPAEGFARFVRACHSHGVGLLLDWVPGHFPTDDFGLAQFDGTPLYEYADPREGYHHDWNTLIYNFGRTEEIGRAHV
jgi:1,4-alpha-glucan branching enzyme